MTDSTIKPPAVAGQFYPADASALRDMLQQFFAHALQVDRIPKAIIAPHAGYIYSGQIAAHAYSVLPRMAKQIKRVILLGPAHCVAVKQFAIPSTDYFATPLGEVELDHDTLQHLARQPQFTINDQAFAKEHSLEVHLPFLQFTLKAFKLTPILIGQAQQTTVANLLSTLWGDETTLIIISSDLSHFHDYQTAQQCDQQTTTEIEQLAPAGLSYQQACGRNGINGLLRYARKHHGIIKTLATCNSGDTAGNKQRVVGYGAYHLYMPETAQDNSAQKILALTKQAIAHKLGLTPAINSHDLNNLLPEYLNQGASFVTLNLHQQLRGCIGSLQPHRRLIDDILANAIAAAFNDRRFKPLNRQEFAHIDLHISILNPAEKMTCTSNHDLLQQLRPGIDGLIIKDQTHQATFLPSVWQSLPKPEDFVRRLKQKAGLEVDHWSETIELYRYTVRDL